METWTILTYPPSVMESSGFRVIAEHVEEDHVLLLLVFADLSVFCPQLLLRLNSESMRLNVLFLLLLQYRNPVGTFPLIRLSVYA